MSKHTKGPFSSTRPSLNLKTGEPHTISILAPEKENGWSTVLAEITVRNVPEGEAEANARLFAAAPDLLDALRSLGVKPEGYCFCLDIEQMEIHTGECLKARMALEKAERCAS